MSDAYMADPRPYIPVRVKRYVYNPAFGDDKVCQCGHEYHRHFDSYENMRNVGCKYCGCKRWRAPEVEA